MTIERCRLNLIDLLSDAENRVIALSGKWGTGKSHLWKHGVQAESTDAKVREAVYVSLFGLASLGDLKLKIAQGRLLKTQSDKAVAEAVRPILGGIRKVLTSIHPGFSALDEVAFLAMPALLTGQFLVIDDIERKHQALSIDEILGFIDDCVQNLTCRILLILNSDKLEDQELWGRLREKVIDQELHLNTSPSEAFDIAIESTPTLYAAQIRPAVEACQITNIRIIRKIIRVVNRLLGNRADLSDVVLERVIPSTTLLGAIYYKGLDDGPDLDFVLRQTDPFLSGSAWHTGNRDKEQTPETKAQERWLLLLDKLSIRGTGDYENLVVDYLKSGLFEGEAVGRVIDRYVAQGRDLAVESRVKEFFHRCVWHPEITEAELLKDVGAILPDVGLLDMFSVTSLHDEAKSLAGGASLAQELVDGWLAAFRQRHAVEHDPLLDRPVNPFRRPLHPEIEAEILAAQVRQRSNATVLEVCRTVRDNGAWGDREKLFMRSVTPADYEAEILATTGTDLKLLLLQSMDFLKNRHIYDSHFGGATQSFLEACRTIVTRDPGSRFAKLIRGVLQSGGF